MCGIVGAVAQREVMPILLEGLRRLEYRGYDSAGMVLLDTHHRLCRQRAVGRVAALADCLAQAPLEGQVGLAHTRWATHGRPTEENAHPHVSGNRVALVHNGIIENHIALRDAQIGDGYVMASETDTEVIAHEIDRFLHTEGALLSAVQAAVRQLEGAYAIAVISTEQPERMVVAREGSPLVIGVGIGEHFVASDVAALLPVTQRFIQLEEGDVAEILCDEVHIYDREGRPVERRVQQSSLSPEAVERGAYRHFMLKEIHEQPQAIAETLEGRITGTQVLEAAFGHGAEAVLRETAGVHIVACGTSYHAAMVARYWIESIAGIPCMAEIASEYRYRDPIVPPHTLFVTLSQSGETADTLAALRSAKQKAYLGTLAVCNVPESSLVRESDFALMTRAGPEVGVASTKAFTTQLVALMLLTIALGRHQRLSREAEGKLVAELLALPKQIERVLSLEPQIAQLAEGFVHKRHTLFLGRGVEYPIALEGALKLKEISYIHAEAYAAGELKHGPLALVDEEMPVVAVAPNNELLGKLLSNLQEVRARGGQLVVFAGAGVTVPEPGDPRVIVLPAEHSALSPAIYVVPLQLLAYYVAVLKGTDVDHPRNLAKAVTVE